MYEQEVTRAVIYGDILLFALAFLVGLFVGVVLVYILTRDEEEDLNYRPVSRLPMAERKPMSKDEEYHETARRG